MTRRPNLVTTITAVVLAGWATRRPVSAAPAARDLLRRATAAYIDGRKQVAREIRRGSDLQRARRLARGQFQRARELARRVLATEPRSRPGLRLVGLSSCYLEDAPAAKRAAAALPSSSKGLIFHTCKDAGAPIPRPPHYHPPYIGRIPPAPPVRDGALIARRRNRVVEYYQRKLSLRQPGLRDWQIRERRARIAHHAELCAHDERGRGWIEIEGALTPSGSATVLQLRGELAATPTGDCIRRVLGGLRFWPRRERLSFRYSFDLHSAGPGTPPSLGPGRRR